MPAAVDEFRAALRLNPRLSFVQYKLATLVGGKLPQADLASQRGLLEESGLPEDQQLLLHFGASLSRNHDSKQAIDSSSVLT